MEIEKLNDNIETILFNQNSRHPINEIEYSWTAKGDTGGVLESTYSLENYRNTHSPSYAIKSKPNHPNMEGLLKLYSSVVNNDFLKKQLITELKNKIIFERSSGYVYSNLRYFLLEFLIKINKIDFIFIYWDKFFKNRLNVYEKLGSLICYEVQLFKPEELNKILKKLNEDHDKPYDLKKDVMEVRLENEIEEIIELIQFFKHSKLMYELEQRENPEINFDVEKVLKKLDYFKFSPDLSKL
ncbi:MAG: hypothetical protein KAU95_01455, partial [Candidatus Aenigmarchaeota archaeon]|nr:hypothetical protein [Candidatus Aenigmarchaeota archaeon]